MRAERVVAALLWFLQAWFRQLSSETNSLPQLVHDGASMNWHMLPSRLQDDATELQRYFQVSPKLLGFGEACPGVLKVSCCGVHHGLYEIWRQVCQWFGFALRLCSWSRMLARENPCRRIYMHLASRTSWSSILYRSFLFAMLCFSSFCCISYIQTPNKPC